MENPDVVDAVLEDGTLTITAKAVGESTVTTDSGVYTITVVEFNPSDVTPLTVEYWITNLTTRTLESTTDSPVITQQISAGADGVATAEGTDINAMMPAWTIKKDGDSGDDREVEFWHVRLLNRTLENNSASETEEQTLEAGDDETTGGYAVTRVRYYDPGDGNGRRWQLLSGDTWLDVNLENNQIVAYYMEVVDIQNSNGTTELHVNAADWGKLGDNSPASSYADTSNYCSISLQIVYEDGSTNPASTTAADLDSNTLIFNYWSSGRGIGTFAFDTLGQFDIYQVTAETGAVVNLSMVDTIVDGGDTDATNGQVGDMNGLPIVSLVDLQNLPHDTYTVTITKIMDTELVQIDGIRVFNTVADSSIFVDDLEDNPDFYELRDVVLHAIGVGEDTSVDYKTMYEQVYDEVEGAVAMITDGSVPYGSDDTVQDLLDNGPKNELFLYPGQTLSFKVSTNRAMQVGLKAPQGNTGASITVDNGTPVAQPVNSSVDMFYTLTGRAGSETEYMVQIENTGNAILSVTLLKICDDPNAAFVPLTLEDIEGILADTDSDDAGEETPDEPEVPEDNTETSKPSKPGKPSNDKPNKPGSNSSGRPAKKTVSTEANATLNVVFVNLRGKAVGTATITESGVSGECCTFSASEIGAKAPAGRHAVRMLPVSVPYGSTASAVVPVL